MMRNVFEALKTVKWTDSESRIAELIRKEPVEFLDLSGKQIAAQCHVSPATLYRVCDKLEMDGLADLKVRVSSSLEAYLKQKDDFDYDFPLRPEENANRIVNSLQKDYEQTVLAVSSSMMMDQLTGIVELMKQAKVIDIYTSAGNVFFAQNFRFQMAEIGETVNVPEEEYYQLLTASTSDETHLAIMISFGGRGILTKYIPQILKQQNTPIVLLSSKEYADRFKDSRYHLYMNSAESHYNKISSFSTRLSCLFLLDVIYASYFETDYEGLLNRKLSYYKNLVGGRKKKGEE